MTTEELNAIRKRAKDSISRIANDDEPGILPVRVIHEDVPALCAEVGRLRRAVAEARAIIEHFWSIHRTDVLCKAEQWLEGNPLEP